MNESKLLSSEEDCLDGHQESFLHRSSSVELASSADLVPDDDSKFFLLAPGAETPLGLPKPGTSSLADLPDPDAASAATALHNSDCLFGSTPPPDVISSHRLHEPDPNAYCCVPGTSFIFESVQDSMLCKAEPSAITVDCTSGLDSWAAAAVAANQHLPRIVQSQSIHQQAYLAQQQPQHPQHMQHHPIYQHHQQQQHHDVVSVDHQAKFVLQLPNLSSNIGVVPVSSTNHCVSQTGYGHLMDAPKRSRTNLTEEQKLELEKTFVKSKYPDYPIVDELSRCIGLPYKKVLVWFKNRRAKEKRTHKADFDPCSIEHMHQHQQHLHQQRKSFGSNGSSSVVSEASTSAASLSAFNAAVAAAAAAAVTATQQQNPISQFPYAQYSMRKRLLPPTAQQQQQQQQQQQLTELHESSLLHHQPITIATNGATIHYQQQLPVAPAAATYWIERSDLSSSLYHYHHYHPFPLLPAPHPPPPLPPPQPPCRQSAAQPRGHPGFAYSGENIATQTSPPIMMLDDFSDRVVEDADAVFGLDDGAHISL